MDLQFGRQETKMIKAGSRIKVIAINKGIGKLYPTNFDDMIGLIGTVTKRKNESGYVELDLDEDGPNWVFERKDIKVID